MKNEMLILWRARIPSKYLQKEPVEPNGVVVGCSGVSGSRLVVLLWVVGTSGLLSPFVELLEMVDGPEIKTWLLKSIVIKIIQVSF